MPFSGPFSDFNRLRWTTLSRMVATPQKMLHEPSAGPAARAGSVDWLAVVRQVATSRALDELEETKLVPQRKVLYQFSARGHEVTQVVLGTFLTGPRDGVGAYYR